jgi:hypothetical protein
MYAVTSSMNMNYSLPWTCIWNLQYCINIQLKRYFVINHTISCWSIKGPIFADIGMFIWKDHALSITHLLLLMIPLYILVPGNLEGDRSEEVVLCSHHFWERVVHPRDHPMAAALFLHESIIWSKRFRSIDKFRSPLKTSTVSLHIFQLFSEFSGLFLEIALFYHPTWW